MKPYILLLVTAICFFLSAMAIIIFTSDINHGNTNQFIYKKIDTGLKSEGIYKDPNLELVWSTTDKYLANPHKVIAHKDRLYIQDYRGEKPIPVFDNNGCFIHYMGQWGRGAGELNMGYKIVGFLDNYLVVFDDQTKRLILFDSGSGDPASEKILDINDPILTGQSIISRVRVSLDALAFSVTLNQNLETGRDTVIIGNYKEVPEIAAAKNNYLLKQGPWDADNTGNVFMAFHDASLILGFTPSGEIIFKTSLPYRIDKLPDFIRHPAANAPLSSPNRDEYPKQYIGLTVDDKYVYGLYSGFQIKTRQDLLQVDKLSEGEILNIFNKQTSEYFFSLNLPYPFRDIAVADNALYALTVNPEVKLVKFKKPDILQ